MGLDKTIKAPDGLRGAGLKEWKRITKLLEDTSFIDALDTQTIFAYCEAVQEFDILVKQLAKEDHVIENAKGIIVANPIVGMKNKASELCLKLAKEIGLTPTARLKLGQMEDEAKDEFKEFMNE